MKIVCEVCRKMGYLQHIGKSYYRIRHYIGLNPNSKKPRFEYHKQSLLYVKKILTNKDNSSNIDLNDQSNIDLKLLNNCSLTENTRAGSLARLGHPLDVRKVTGSNPVRPTKTDKNVGINQESIR